MRCWRFWRGNADELETGIVISGCVFTTATQTRGGSTKGADALELGFAIWAKVDVFDVLFAARQRQVVASGLVSDSEICAGALPFCAVRCNLTASGSMLRD